MSSALPSTGLALTLTFSACTQSYHPERGLAFSLWDRHAEQELNAPFPAHLASSPEPLFEAVVARHPRFHGQFPTRFSGNFSAGVYIAADQIGDALAWLEDALAPVKKGVQRRYRGLLAVLRAAAAKGLAYWEATELSLPTYAPPRRLALAPFLDDSPPAPPLRTVDLPGGSFGYGTRTVRPHCVVLTGPDNSTLYVELDDWPPFLTWRRPETIIRADRDGEGRWLFIAVRAPWSGDPFAELQMAPALLSHETRIPYLDPDVFPGGVQDGVLIGGRPLVLPARSPHDVAAPDCVWIYGGGAWDDERPAMQGLPSGWSPAPGLPERMPVLVNGGSWPRRLQIVRLDDGAEIVLWDGAGYEWTGSEFTQTFDLQLQGRHEEIHVVPAESGGIFYAIGRQLYALQRGGTPVAHDLPIEDICALHTGPDGGLLITEQHDNADGDAAKLYVPQERSLIPIAKTQFGDAELYHFACWNKSGQKIFGFTPDALHALYVEDVLALPRRAV